MDKQTDNIVAKRFLKMEMLRRGISAEKLQTLLSDHGYSYTLAKLAEVRSAQHSYCNALK